MRLLGLNHVLNFIKKHPNSAPALRRWIQIIENTHFKNFVDLRKTFPQADQVKGKTVFNVGGNKIRTITLVEYNIAQILILDILTHAEYDKEKWK